MEKQFSKIPYKNEGLSKKESLPLNDKSDVVENNAGQFNEGKNDYSIAERHIPSNPQHPSDLSKGTSITGTGLKSPMLQRVETIMSDGLARSYNEMTVEQQRRFKEKGEDVALQIEGLLYKTKIKIKKIISLLNSWLRLIPGVNKYFIEQESKIKADKILKEFRGK